MHSLPADIHSIIFDLGGVIVDLSTEKTAKAFANLAAISERDVFHAYHTNASFNAFERGEISSADFRNSIRNIFSIRATDSEIDTCWNSMLVDLPAGKLRILEKLKPNFNTLLLSNTNEIHLRHIEEIMLAGGSLDNFFHSAYYSHKVGMRKPDSIIFEHIMKENSLASSQTVFLDDNVENIEAAKSLGIQTIHITHPDLVFDIFKKYD